MIVIMVLAMIIFGVSAWFYGYYSHKSNDNLPSLSSIIEMENVEVNESVVGYLRTQLRYMWKEPDKIDSDMKYMGNR